jgi:hypothetical protein
MISKVTGMKFSDLALAKDWLETDPSLLLLTAIKSSEKPVSAHTRASVMQI